MQEGSDLRVSLRRDRGQWVAECGTFPDLLVRVDIYESLLLAIDAELAVQFSAHPELGAPPKSEAWGIEWQFAEVANRATRIRWGRIASRELRELKRRMDRRGEMDEAYHFWFDDEPWPSSSPSRTS
jgi:hypothetical protein